MIFLPLWSFGFTYNRSVIYHLQINIFCLISKSHYSFLKIDLLCLHKWHLYFNVHHHCVKYIVKLHFLPHQRNANLIYYFRLKIWFYIILYLRCKCFVYMSVYLQMTSLVLPGMVAKKKGIIINISSGSGKFPVPLLTLYSATKVLFNANCHAICDKSACHI